MNCQLLIKPLITRILTRFRGFLLGLGDFPIIQHQTTPVPQNGNYPLTIFAIESKRSPTLQWLLFTSPFPDLAVACP